MLKNACGAKIEDDILSKQNANILKQKKENERGFRFLDRNISCSNMEEGGLLTAWHRMTIQKTSG